MDNEEIMFLIGFCFGLFSLVTGILFITASDNRTGIDNTALDKVCKDYFGQDYSFAPSFMGQEQIRCVKNETMIITNYPVIKVENNG